MWSYFDVARIGFTVAMSDSRRRTTVPPSCGLLSSTASFSGARSSRAQANSVSANNRTSLDDLTRRLWHRNRLGRHVVEPVDRAEDHELPRHRGARELVRLVGRVGNAVDRLDPNPLPGGDRVLHPPDRRN